MNNIPAAAWVIAPAQRNAFAEARSTNIPGCMWRPGLPAGAFKVRPGDAAIESCPFRKTFSLTRGLKSGLSQYVALHDDY
jgi:hypothetical protein